MQSPLAIEQSKTAEKSSIIKLLIAMYRLTCDIQIETSDGRVTLDHASSVSIKKDADRLTDVATITLPRRLRWTNVDKNPIRRGDPVRISLGYDDSNHLAFVGTVARVSTDTPLTIECQDPMAALQTLKAKHLAYTSVTLDRLLADQGLAPVVKGSQSLGAYRVECNTVAELLDALKRQGIRSHYRLGSSSEPRLYSGLLLAPDDVRTFPFDDHLNVVSRANLRYTPADQVRFLVRVKCRETASSRSVSTFDLGDPDGELRTFNVVSMTPAEVRSYASDQLSLLRRGSLSGSLTVFGGEIVDVLDAISLTLDSSPVGTFQVSKNDISWGPSGFRQSLTIGTKIN